MANKCRLVGWQPPSLGVFVRACVSGRAGQKFAQLKRIFYCLIAIVPLLFNITLLFCYSRHQATNDFTKFFDIYCHQHVCQACFDVLALDSKSKVHKDINVRVCGTPASTRLKLIFWIFCFYMTSRTCRLQQRFDTCCAFCSPSTNYLSFIRLYTKK